MWQNCPHKSRTPAAQTLKNLMVKHGEVERASGSTQDVDLDAETDILGVYDDYCDDSDCSSESAIPTHFMGVVDEPEIASMGEEVWVSGFTFGIPSI